MNVHCPHCRHEQQVSEALINKVVDCPSCKRRYLVKRPPPPPTAEKGGIGFGTVLLLLLLIAGGALGYICWKQQASPIDLARQLLQRFQPQQTVVLATPPHEEPAPEEDAPQPMSAESSTQSPTESAEATPPTIPEPVAPSAETSAPTPAPTVAIDPLAWLHESRTHWPQEVSLTLPVGFSLKSEGKSVGAVTLQPGSSVSLIQIKDDNVTVSHAGTERTIPMDATDLLVRARAEIDRRDALIQHAAPRSAPATASHAPMGITGTRVTSTTSTETLPPVRTTGAFVHPGGLHTKADLDRMKTMVAANEHPWIDAWNQFITDRKAQNTYRASPGANMPSRQRAQDDATAMYYNALRWYISGDKSYADCAVRIANAWANTVDARPANDYLTGIPTGSFALAGEVLRVYPGWSASEFSKFKKMLVQHWYPKCDDFLRTHNGTKDSSYWANWDACNMLGILGIGVLCDDREKFDQAIEYFKHGKGMGSIKNALPFRYPDGLGQWQENGRDFAHTMGGMGLLAEFCQVAWNQGLDLFGMDDNWLLAGAEYTAQYTLWKGVPYTYYTNSSGANQSYISTNYRGRLDASHFELVYNHYIVRRGLKAPNVKQFVEMKRPEPGETDVFGHGTLTFTLDKAASPYPVLAIPPVPQDLVAIAGMDHVDLKWSPSGAYSAHGYEVLRATSLTGPYTSIHSTNRWTTPAYTDTEVTNGTTYYYKVSALNNTGTSAPSAAVSATPAAGRPLPPGWLAANIGDSATTTDDSYAPVANSTFTLPATGSGIGGESDTCHYVYQKVSGDFTFTARLINRKGDIYKTGLMMREGPEANAKMLVVTLGEAGGRQARFGTRATTGGRTLTQAGNDYTWLPMWFRLQRVGDEFTAVQSPDGITWFQVGKSTVALRKPYLAGLVVAAAAGGKAKEGPANVSFDNVTMTVTPPAAPVAPTALAATALPGGDVQLTWKNNATNQSGFKVDASVNNAGFYEIADLAATATRFVNTGLSTPTAVRYRVRAYNTGGYSDYSNTAGLAAP